MKLHAITFEATRRVAGEGGLEGDVEKLARFSVDSNVIAATMGDHAKS